MRFRMLGALEAWDGEAPVALGGTKQRATLGMLLLRANTAVATSRLIGALWAPDEAPVSARKILQNAVWGLRGALAQHRKDRGEAFLVTQPPGYMLTVDPEDVDLYVFLRLAADGRTELARGHPAQALATLRRALAMWRGPLLADVVETGISWPELTAMDNARLDALEDYFEAAMLCGQHQEVLRELEIMVDREPLRERSCAQLMLALYRSGRHVDSLDVYARMRDVLVAQLGLDPGRNLQLLQQAILNHDPSLALTPPLPLPLPPQTPPAELKVSKQRVSFLLVRCRADAGLSLERVEEQLDRACGAVRQTAPLWGGVPVATFGSICTAVFEGTDNHHAAEAVRAALEIREQLSHQGDHADVKAQIIVATGEALLRRDGDGSVTVRGIPVDQCQDLLGSAPEGEVVVCAQTRHMAGRVFRFVRAPSDSTCFLVEGVSWAVRQIQSLPLVDRECELGMLKKTLERARHRNRPHLVTVLGDRGNGKSRILSEFERRIVAYPQDVTLVSWQPKSGFVVRRGLGTDLPERLGALVDPGQQQADSLELMLRRWQDVVPVIPADHPVVMTIDDLHRLPDVLLDFVHQVGSVSGATPLVVVGTARPELLQRRPGWSGGVGHTSTITLDPLTDAALDELLQVVRSRSWGEASMPLIAADAEGDRVAIVDRRSDLRKLLRQTA